jgi:uncharacterized membrane protein
MEVKDLGKTSTGMQANVAALASYVLGWITGLIFFFVEKDNKFIRFHALQSIVVFGSISALWFILSILSQFFLMLHVYFIFKFLTLTLNLLGLISLIVWILLMVKAYQGEKFKLPIVGDITEKMLENNSVK